MHGGNPCVCAQKGIDHKNIYIVVRLCGRPCCNNKSSSIYCSDLRIHLASCGAKLSKIIFQRHASKALWFVRISMVTLLFNLFLGRLGRITCSKIGQEWELDQSCIPFQFGPDLRQNEPKGWKRGYSPSLCI